MTRIRLRVPLEFSVLLHLALLGGYSFSVGVVAWAPNQGTSRVRPAYTISSLLPVLTKSMHHQRGRCPAFGSALFQAKVDTSSDKDDSVPGQVQQLLKGFVKSLGKGILFAIPMKPSVTNALFGIKSKRKNQKMDSIVPSVSFTLREGLTAISIYLGVGVFAYSMLMEHWSFIDALYFSVVSFTTVGYGDLSPHTRASKIFTCFFSLGGIAFLAAALASIGSNLIEVELKTVKAAQKMSRNRVFRMFERMPLVRSRLDKRSQQAVLNAPIHANSTITAVVPFNVTASLTGEAALPQPKPKTVVDICRGMFLKLIPPLMFLTFGGLALGRLEKWSVVDSIYYAIITAGTVGFGDVCPGTQRARLWAVLFIPLAVAAGGEILGTIASAYLEHRRNVVFENLTSMDFTMEHIKEMDNDGDGVVSQLEYTEFMLVEMKLVEKSVLDELREQFGRLDMNMSGSLSKEDLVLMAKLRRSKERVSDDPSIDPAVESLFV
jgi:potassium channel subfamily K